jgi:hypothetical protein
VQVFTEKWEMLSYSELCGSLYALGAMLQGRPTFLGMKPEISI